MSDQIFYLFSAALLGLVVGALIMYFATGSNKESEKTIAKLEKELENYQQNVAEHFEETANLVDGMTKSYKKVFDHLGKSARKLMTEEQIQKQLELRKGNKVTLEYLTESNEIEPNSHDIEEIINDSESEKESTDELSQVETSNDNDDIESKENSDESNDSGEPEVNKDADESNDSGEPEVNKDADEENVDEISEDEIFILDNADDEVDEVDEEIDLEKEVEIREKNLYN